MLAVCFFNQKENLKILTTSFQPPNDQWVDFRFVCFRLPFAVDMGGINHSIFIMTSSKVTRKHSQSKIWRLIDHGSKMAKCKCTGLDLITDCHPKTICIIVIRYFLLSLYNNEPKWLNWIISINLLVSCLAL